VYLCPFRLLFSPKLCYCLYSEIDVILIQNYFLVPKEGQGLLLTPENKLLPEMDIVIMTHLNKEESSSFLFPFIYRGYCL
jgi:hypothetical protein